jgi:hypothetical protein
LGLRTVGITTSPQREIALWRPGPSRYESSGRRFRAQVDASSVSLVRKKGGAGGVQETPVRVLADMRLALRDTVVVSKQLDVVLQPLVPHVEDNYLDCNIGRDLLDRYSELVLNFREMAFILR